LPRKVKLMENFIRPSFFLGAILGLIFGILLLMPFIAPLVFFLVFLVAGVIVIIIMKKTNSIGIISLQDGCLIGALAGFSSLLSASAVFIPVSFLINKIFNVYSGGFNFSKSLSITGYDIMAVSMLVVFTAVLSAIINAFTGMVTAFVYEKAENKGIKFEDHLYAEQIDQSVE